MMKRIGLMGLMGIMAIGALAQGYSVRTLAGDPRNEFNAVPGCPTNWPVAVDRLEPGQTNPWPDRIVLTEAQLANVYRVIGPAFTNWHSTVWRAYRSAQAQAEITKGQTQGVEIKAAFDELQMGMLRLETNTFNATNLMAVIHKQNELIARLRPLMESTPLSEIGGQRSVVAQGIQEAPAPKPVVRRRTAKRVE